jgi:hypothetical protein
MKTFVQLKDGIGWASVNTNGEVEGSIEVEYGTGDSYIGKKYENNSWSDADLIRYSVLDADENVIEVRQTYYSSEVTGPVLPTE